VTQFHKTTTEELWGFCSCVAENLASKVWRYVSG